MPYEQKWANFSIFRPPKKHENLKFLEGENANKNSKRALHVVTRNNKCLK